MKNTIILILTIFTLVIQSNGQISNKPQSILVEATTLNAEYAKIEKEVLNYASQLNKEEMMQLKEAINKHIDNNYGYVSRDPEAMQLYGKSYFVKEWSEMNLRK